MYDVKPNLTIGFHGCDRSVRDHLLLHPNDYKISRKPFDWLGHGLYFWENNYERALQWAHDKKKRGSIQEPAVISAILSLGHCCDFLEKRNIDLIAYYFRNMKMEYELHEITLPINKDQRTDQHKDKVLRNLDCATIEFMHSEILEEYKKNYLELGFSNYKIFDSTRGVFTEGGPAYDGAGLPEKSPHTKVDSSNNSSHLSYSPRLPRKYLYPYLWQKSVGISNGRNTSKNGSENGIPGSALSVAASYP